MEYKVVYKQSEHISTALSNLEKEVKIHQKEGWKCQGGISISRDLWGHVAQAMVKE